MTSCFSKTRRLINQTRRVLICTLLFFSVISQARAEVNIVTTIRPLQLIAEAVIQGHGSTASIIDPQQSPHHFSMSPSDRVALAQADIAIWVGPAFETYLTDFFAQTNLSEKSLTLIDIPGLRLHTIAEDQIDAHLWLDSSNAVRIAQAISTRVAALDPQNEVAYRDNLSRFEAGVDALNSELLQKFSRQPKAEYAVYHNAYQYFEKQFGLRHALFILQDPEQPPGIHEIIQLRQDFQNRAPSCLLSQTDASAELVNTVLNGHQLQSISIDLLASRVRADQDGYLQFMKNLADDFAACLYNDESLNALLNSKITLSGRGTSWLN